MSPNRAHVFKPLADKAGLKKKDKFSRPTKCKLHSSKWTKKGYGCIRTNNLLYAKQTFCSQHQYINLLINFKRIIHCYLFNSSYQKGMCEYKRNIAPPPAAKIAVGKKCIEPSHTKYTYKEWWASSHIDKRKEKRKERKKIKTRLLNTRKPMWMRIWDAQMRSADVFTMWDARMRSADVFTMRRAKKFSRKCTTQQIGREREPSACIKSYVSMQMEP